MPFIKNLQNIFVASLLMFASTIALACGHDTSPIENISLQKSTFLATDANFDDYTKTELAAIDAVVQKLGLEKFKIVSRDLSINKTDQATGMYQVYFGVSLNFTPHDKAFSEFVRKLDVNNASQYIYDEESNCENHD